jgi:tetratricopeptide (TPR) repeat protein
MKITRILFSAAIMVAVLFTSCQQKAGQQKTAQSETEEIDEFEQKLQNINPGLKDPSIVMVVLDMAGAEYIDGLVVPMENVDVYAKDKAHAALALGVYTVDIAYLASYGKTDQALIKYERARKLAAAIGLVSSFEEGMFERYVTAGADPDTLRRNLTLTAKNINEELSQGELARHATLFVTGEFIEKMYVLTQVIDQYPDDFPEDVRSQLVRHLVMGVVEQEEALNDLIELLNQIREDGEGEEFMAEMKALKQVYDEANFKEMIANWTPQTTAGGEYLARITDHVDRLRTRIVSTDR